MLKKYSKYGILLIIILSAVLVLAGCSVNENLNTTNSTAKEEYFNLREQIEKDEADYGDDYLKFTHCPSVYKREPDRIYFKSSNIEGFYLFEKEEQNYEHLLEVSEDRMSYAVMEDFNLWSFTPDSIDTMMSSGDNYIIFDYDNGDLDEYNSEFQKDIIFRFPEKTRLYRLVSYLSYYKNLILKEELGKEEFASDTSISGYKYMMYGNDYDSD